MISIQEATATVLAHKMNLLVEQIPIAEALGRQLREPLFADRPFPPFNRVAMDGIAVRSVDYENGQRLFPIKGIQAAGAAQLSIDEVGVCMEVMTGAILPNGLDTVVRYEDVEIENGIAKITAGAYFKYKNVHQEGTDRPFGANLVATGKLLSAADIAVAATIGKAELLVSKLPKMAIVTTGDELVDIHAIPLPYQIRSSNVYALKALFTKEGIDADSYHIVDDEEETKEQLAKIIDSYDVLVLSGGVSKGKYDFVPAALKAIGVEQLFHRVRQKPGKPFWFGKAKSGALVFALPGNPVSAFMCAIRYVLPWLNASMNKAPLSPYFAQLATDFSFKAPLRYFLQVKLSYTENGSCLAHPVAGKGSGDLANLSDADAFMELPENETNFEKGKAYRIWKI